MAVKFEPAGLLYRSAPAAKVVSTSTFWLSNEDGALDRLADAMREARRQDILAAETDQPHDSGFARRGMC